MYPGTTSGIKSIDFPGRQNLGKEADVSQGILPKSGSWLGKQNKATGFFIYNLLNMVINSVLVSTEHGI